MTEKIGTTKSDPEKAKEVASRSGMAKGTVSTAETGSEYEQSTSVKEKVKCRRESEYSPVVNEYKKIRFTLAYYDYKSKDGFTKSH
jgi:hypothetical protein